MTHRLAAFLEFVTAYVPEPPARILEVGCGDGELARALAERGYEVIAIDPHAPEGEIFRHVRLEDFADEARFDAVVASVSLHHIGLTEAFDKIVALLEPDGVLVLDEFAKERITGATARWYYHQRRALAEAGRAGSAVPADFDAWERERAARHEHIHSASAIRAELERRFDERYFGWQPYLYDYSLDDDLEPLERRLIDEGGIEATGFRYVGVPL